jgi:hypothetical protein
MIDLADDNDLRTRARAARRAMIAGVCLASFALVLLVLLIEPGSGVSDVHVPSDGRHLIDDHRSLLAAGEPAIVGRGWGRLSQVVATVLSAGSLVAAGLALWGLVRRRRAVAWIGAGYVVVMGLAGPIPTTMQPEPPIVVAAATAARLLATETADGAAWRRYMMAQVAYVRGDRTGAATLARGIGPGDLHSPIESRYRLQFLQGLPITKTSVCFKFGCLDRAQRRSAVRFALVFLAAGVAAVAGLGWLLILLTRRLRRIDALRTDGVLRRRLT